MDGPYNRHMADRGRSTMTTRFEEYPERRARSTSRPAPTIVSSTTSQSSSPERQPPTPQTKPLKGILKVTGNTVDPRRAEEAAAAQERSQELLARRFYRVPRPDPLHHAPLYPQALPQLSPQYYPDGSWGNFDTETESASSELSYNTQATSIASDDTAATPAKRTQVIHIRRVPPVSRVRTRPRSRPSSDAGTVSTRQSRRRVVNIQVIPANKEKEREPSNQLQLARTGERDLLERIEHLEGEADTLRESRNQLSRDLHDASERLSVKEFGSREVERLLKQERTEKEYLYNDLEKQRQILDEFRSNYELQRGTLQETEQERDSLRQTRDKLEHQLSRVTRASKLRFEASKAQEAELARQITTFEGAVVALEQKINSQEREVQELTKERDTFRQDADKYLGQLRELASERDGFRRESEEHLAKVEALSVEQETLKKEKHDLEANLAALQTRVDGFEGERESLENRFAQAAGDNKMHQERIQGYEAEVRILHARITSLREEGNTLKDQIATFEPEKQALQKQLEESKQAFDQQLEADRQAFEKELAAERADRASQFQKLTTELDGAKAANISLASQGLELQAKLAGVQGELDAARARVGELEQARASLGAEAEQLRARAAELEGALGAKAADIEKLEARAADLEKQTRDLEQRAGELAQLQDQHKKLEDRAAGLQAELDKAQESLRAATAAAAEAEARSRAPPPAPAPEPTSTPATPAPAPAVVDVSAFLEDARTQEQQDADAANRFLALEAANQQLQAEVRRIPALEESNRALQAEAGRVPGLAQQAQSLSAQLASIAQQLQQVSAAHMAATAQVGDLQATVNKLQYQQQQQQIGGGSTTTTNGTSSERRNKSRSSERHRRTGSNERARSSGGSGSGEKLIFMRKPGDRGGALYITTREALRSEAKGGD